MTRSKQTKILAVLEDKSVCICAMFFFFVVLFLITFIGYNTCNDN